MTPVIENFIAKLASNLSTLSDSEQRYALDFYRTFLLDGDFQTKEEIIKELGTPNSLANEIKQDYVKFLTAVMSSANNPHASDNYFNGLRVKNIPAENVYFHLQLLIKSSWQCIAQTSLSI
ncbi:DUF1700 domain-containing protein [Lactobacillus sp. R2/2]|nr:DUF1700 domain-containing protein [Lactobacillus sp. R2/2]